MISGPTRLIPTSCPMIADLDMPDYVLSILAAAQLTSNFV